MNTIAYRSSGKHQAKELTSTNEAPVQPVNQMFREWMLRDENNVERIYGATVQYGQRLTNRKTLVIYATNLSEWLQLMVSRKALFVRKRTTEFQLTNGTLAWEYGVIHELYVADKTVKTVASRERQIYLAGQLIKKLGFSERKIFLTVREGSGANQFTNVCDLFIDEVKERVNRIFQETAPSMCRHKIVHTSSLEG